MEGDHTLMFCVLALVYLTTASSVPNPGFKARITENGLTYANKVAIEQLSKRASNQHIPEISGKSKAVSYSFDGSITEFTPPSPSSLVLIPNQGLEWSASGIGLKLHGKYGVSYKKFIKISKNGSLDAEIAGVGFSVQALFGVDSNGRPSIRAGDCTSDIGKVDIKFIGDGIGTWLLNLFRKPLGDKIKGALNRKLVTSRSQCPQDIIMLASFPECSPKAVLSSVHMCDLISDSLNKGAEESLSKLKVTTNIGKYFTLDYRLVGAPTFSSGYMETKHKGEMFWKGDTKDPPFQPPPLPSSSSSSRMLYLWVSEYMMNSLLYQAQQHNFLHYNLTAKDLPADQRSALNTTCTGTLCIGNFIPQLQKSYPNCQVGFYLKSTTVPKVGVVNGTVVASMRGTIDMYAFPADKSTTLYFRSNSLKDRGLVTPHYILTLGANMTLTGNISLSDQLLHYKIKDIKLPVSLMNSTIPNVNSEALNFIMNNAIKTFVEPSINSLGQTGIPLPLNGKVTFKNAELSLLQNSFMVATDLVYDPSAEVHTY